MTPIWAWARRELSRQRRATLALVLLIGVSGAVVLTTAAGARRTGSAFDRFLEASHTADAQLQYDTEDVDDAELIAALLADPAVERVEPLYITFGFVEGSGYDLGIFAGGEEGLLSETDVPRLLEGRRPDPADPHEVLANPFTQKVLGLEVGDTVTVGTFGPDQITEDGEPEEPTGPEIPLEVTGIAVTAYDLADPEGGGFYATPAFYDEYGTRAFTYGPTLQVSTAEGADPGDVVERVVSDFDLDEVFVNERSQQTERIEDGTRVLSVGLWAFAAVAGLAALVAGAQALHRRTAEAADDLPALRAVGFSRSECALAVIAASLPGVVLGVALAAVLAGLGSATMPIGSARRAEPSPGIDIDLLALGGGGLVLLALLSLAAVVGALRTVRIGLDGSVASRSRTPTASLLASGRFSPSSQLGVAMALDPGEGRTAVPVRSALVGAAFGVAGVAAALTFGSGLDALVDDPAASGWNWTFRADVADEDLETLIDVDGVDDVGRIDFGQVVAGGRRLTGVSMIAEHGAPSFTVVDGRMPSGPREVALGPNTASELRAGIGDTIHLAVPSTDDELDAVVVGTVLVPTFDENPFNEGVALAPDTHAQVRQSEGFRELVVGFDDDVDQDEAAQRIREVLPDALSVYAFPSPPPDVENLAGVQHLPRLLGVFLGLLALAAVAHALATSVRRRRHDLGIVRSLGFIGRDIVRTLTAQSWTLVILGLAVGIPLGVAVGRVAWGVVADGIGVRAQTATSVGALTGLAFGACAAGALLALLPGISAARQRAVDALRVE